MSKKPKIKHDYDHDKDKMKITVRGYALSKTTRDEIMEDVISLIERSPDRVSARARKASGKSTNRKVTRVVAG